MDLVLKLNDQLKETEKELDNLIQSKQSELASTPQTAIPTVSTTVPSTLVASLAPTVPPTTSMLVIGTSTSAGTSTEKTTELVKSMEEITIQATELKRLKEKVTSLETDYKLAKIMHKEEVKKAARISESLKAMEKDLTLKEPLGQAKELLWANIIHSVNDIWQSIQVIFEEIELIKMATEAIQRVKEELGEMPKEATRII